jgi:hypothetical protein
MFLQVFIMRNDLDSVVAGIAKQWIVESAAVSNPRSNGAREGQLFTVNSAWHSSSLRKDTTKSMREMHEPFLERSFQRPIWLESCVIVCV